MVSRTSVRDAEPLPDHVVALGRLAGRYAVDRCVCHAYVLGVLGPQQGADYESVGDGEGV